MCGEYIYILFWCDGEGTGLSNKRCSVRFLANHGGVRKGIGPQMLLCLTSMQVPRPVLILETKTKKHQDFSHSITGYRDYK